jgi:hypothetical protein
MLCILTKACDMKECEAPESKSMVAEMELTLNVPSITLGAELIQTTRDSPCR